MMFRHRCMVQIAFAPHGFSQPQIGSRVKRLDQVYTAAMQSKLYFIFLRKNPAKRCPRIKKL